jgi:hypothetical protein
MKIAEYIAYTIDRLPRGYVFTYADFMGEVKSKEAASMASSVVARSAAAIESAMWVRVSAASRSTDDSFPFSTRRSSWAVIPARPFYGRGLRSTAIERR